MSLVEHFIVADRVFDGRDVRPDVAVGVEGGLISRVLPRTEVPTDAPLQVLPDATLTPGLIDAHVHLAPWMIFGLIAAGVTTVRDVGNDLDGVGPLLDDLHDLPVPTVHWSGPLLESDRVNWPSIALAHASTDDIRATVDRLSSRGLRTIKLYANATAELVEAASDQAHRHGMRVLGHLGASNLADAAASGVDELQHLAGCLAADLGAADWASAAEMVAQVPVDHCPTLVVWEALANLGHPRLTRDAGFAFVPPPTRAAWANAYHASQPAAERVRRLRELLERMAAIPVLLEAGRRVVIGSDSPFPGLIPGVSLHDEAGILVLSGMSALDAMRGLTAGNASVIGSSRGTIAAGAAADLVAFDGDPTDRIADLGQIRHVWLDGRPVDLDRLSSQAADYFARAVVSPVDMIARQRFIPATVA